MCARVADALGDVADEMVCLMAPKGFFTVGQFYADFRPASEAEVVELLRPGPGPCPVDTHDDPPPCGGHATVGERLGRGARRGRWLLSWWAAALSMAATCR